MKMTGSEGQDQPLGGGSCQGLLSRIAHAESVRRSTRLTGVQSTGLGQDGWLRQTHQKTGDAGPLRSSMAVPVNPCSSW